MMTDYNDGNWHPWNGGECPVHPMTRVTVKWSCNGVETDELSAMAFSDHWNGNAICAFRVVREYREPREYWVSRLTGVAYISYETALYDGCHPEYLDHVKEVLG